MTRARTTSATHHTIQGFLCLAAEREIYDGFRDVKSTPIYALFSLPLPPCPRGYADLALKHACKMRAFTETDGEGDLSNFQIAVFQKSACLTQTIAIEIHHRCHAHFLPKTIRQ